VAAVHGSPWFIEKGKLGGGGDQRSGVGGTAEGPGERVVGALVVRMHAKDKALGFCRALHSGGEVETDGGSGGSWRARNRTAGEG
jgi:hypothetical protein